MARRRVLVLGVHRILFMFMFLGVSLLVNFAALSPHFAMKPLPVNIQDMKEYVTAPHLITLRSVETRQVRNAADSHSTPELQSVSSVDEQQRVHFLERNQLGKQDFFAGTWLQPLSTFLDLNTSKISHVEAGCTVVWETHRNQMRMTLDWLDFSVEHMSKWWKVLRVPGGRDPVPYNRTISMFRNYIRNIRVDENDSTMQKTIAVIAFQQHRTKPDPVKGRMLTISSLAATMASLLQAGFGRVVVVGYQDDDSQVVQETFRYLRSRGKLDAIAGSISVEATPITMIGRMEVGYVRATTEEVTSSNVAINVVKGALTGLQRAFKGELSDERGREWLGSKRDSSHWRYVYLTEPDMLLQTRPRALSELRDALDQGLILAPHRLQPIPHEYDVKGMTDHTRYLPATGNYSKVVELDTLQGGVCCDEHAGPFYPGLQLFPRCGTFWWQCGFGYRARKDHSRLAPYQFMRLHSGTGVVNLAATAHGRRCIPKMDSFCEPPDSTEK